MFKILTRKWLIVDENFNSITQRVYPKMALIKTSLDCCFDNIDGDCLVLSAPGKNYIRVPIKPSKHLVECRYLKIRIKRFDFVLICYLIKKK